MKKTLLILAVLATAAFISAGTMRHCEIPAHKYFEFDASSKEAMEIPTSLNTRFDDDSLLDWYILNVDGGSTYWSIFMAPGIAHSGSLLAGCYYDTLYSTSLRNNDWLLTPRVFIQNNSYELRFWTQSIDTSGNWLDDYEVWVSPTGDTSVASFTAMIDSVEDCPSGWHETVISLSDFVGDTIRVAFRYVSQDDWLIMLDDVSILPTTGICGRGDLIEDYRLLGNAPNPFNAATTIRASGNFTGSVEIFGIDGKLVNTIAIEDGRGVWNGSFASGEIAPCGVYFYRLAGSDKVFRMVFLK